jgi:peptidoglycan/LPS O-acetylase OafA/YrhL
MWIRSLTGLRGICALCVVLGHDALSPKFFKDYAVASLAVSIFFCLSGFLSYYVLRNDFLKHNKINFSRFYFRRIIRIWPAYFFSIIIITSATYYFGDLFRQKFDFIPLLTFTSNLSAASFGIWPPPWFGPYWSIAVEEQFYIVAPLIFLAIKSKYRNYFFVSSILAVNFFRFIHMSGVGSPDINNTNGGMYYLTSTYLDIFIGGAALGWLYTENKINLTKIQQQILLLSGLVMLVICGGLWAKSMWPPYSYLTFASYLMLLPAAGLILVGSLPFNQTLFVRFLSTRPLQFLGTISYPIYLYHLFVLDHFNVLPFTEWQPPARYYTGGGWLLLLCLTSYYLVERPFLSLKKDNNVFFINWPILGTVGLVTLGYVLFLLKL